MASRNTTTYLVNTLKADCEFESEAHNNCVYTLKQAYYDESQVRAQQVYDRIISEANDFHKRTLQRARDSLSAWLLAPPIAKDNFDLSANEFRDGLALHYGKPLLQIPPDANHWQDVLLRYGAHSNHLCDSVAALVCHLSNTITPWDDIRALVSCRLIALDKNPGIRPIGIGETLRRIIGKTMCSLTKFNLSDSCNISQLCGGVRCGIEAAIHTISVQRV